MAVSETGHTVSLTILTESGLAVLDEQLPPRVQLSVGWVCAQLWVPGADVHKGRPYVQPQVEAREGQNVSVYAQVKKSTNAWVTQSDVETVTLSVYYLSGSTPGTVLYTTTVDPTDVVYDTLQIDAGWVTDTTGYNFLHAITVSRDIFGEGGGVYRVEYALHLTDEDEEIVEGLVVMRPRMAA